MDNQSELVIPPAALEDADAAEMVRAWVANKALHCTLRIGVWKDVGAWGILLQTWLAMWPTRITSRMAPTLRHPLRESARPSLRRWTRRLTRHPGVSHDRRGGVEQLHAADGRRDHDE